MGVPGCLQSCHQKGEKNVKKIWLPTAPDPSPNNVTWPAATGRSEKCRIPIALERNWKGNIWSLHRMKVVKNGRFSKCGVLGINLSLPPVFLFLSPPSPAEGTVARLFIRFLSYSSSHIICSPILSRTNTNTIIARCNHSLHKNNTYAGKGMAEEGG